MSVTQVRSNFEGKMLNDTRRPDSWVPTGSCKELIDGKTQVVIVIRPGVGRDAPLGHHDPLHADHRRGARRDRAHREAGRGRLIQTPARTVAPTGAQRKSPSSKEEGLFRSGNAGRAAAPLGERSRLLDRKVKQLAKECFEDQIDGNPGTLHTHGGAIPWEGDLCIGGPRPCVCVHQDGRRPTPAAPTEMPLGFWLSLLLSLDSDPHPAVRGRRRRDLRWLGTFVEEGNKERPRQPERPVLRRQLGRSPGHRGRCWTSAARAGSVFNPGGPRLRGDQQPTTVGFDLVPRLRPPGFGPAASGLHGLRPRRDLRLPRRRGGPPGQDHDRRRSSRGRS